MIITLSFFHIQQNKALNKTLKEGVTQKKKMRNQRKLNHSSAQ